MALKISLDKNHNGVTFKSGYIYKFRYRAFENDPEPLGLFLNYVYGIHPNTGHQHRYFQMINLHYIKRSQRKKFAMIWMDRFNKTKGNPILTWKLVKASYPYLEIAIRRYLTKPAYYIIKPRRIDESQIENVIKGTLFKDFSDKLKIKAGRAFRKITGT